MDWLAIILTVLGLCLFETISSIDNAVINASVLKTMSQRARRWFLVWGILFAVFLVRGLLPWLIVWITNPALGPIGAFTASFSNDPRVIEAIETSAPMLLMGGGVFLVFLFLHWLFLEEKHFGLPTERFFYRHGVWFFTIVSLLLCFIVGYNMVDRPFIAFSAVVGSTVFFITHGFKQNAEHAEERLLQKSKKSGMSDISKILYLEIIDASFSIDGVLGAFAFTLSVPLILIGNGLGAVVVRQITLGNIERVQKYVYLKNGAMYSVLFLGLIMVMEGFLIHIPQWISPVVTFSVIGYFYYKSAKELKLNNKVKKVSA
jgi:hypothetical protein